MLTQLTEQDAAFLYLETQETPAHIGGLSLVELPDGHRGSFFEDYKATIASRLPLIPFMHRKLASIPLDLDRAFWVEDEHVDLDYHIRHLTVPSPGTMKELEALVALLHAHPLDRSRPLWEFYVIDGLSSGQQAIYTKMHHAAMDGADRPARARRQQAPGSWSDLRAIGAARPVDASSPEPSQIAGFIYTSGTTGKPKGALLSHDNILSNIKAVHGLVKLSPEDRYLSFLPWAHSYGQTVELHMLLSWGASLAINDELPRLVENLTEVKPTVLVAVPRIFNRIYEAMTRELAGHPGILQRIAQRLRSEPSRAAGEMVTLDADDRGIVQAIRDRFFGGRLRYAFTGSAAISKDVIALIDALGISVYEGYGLTETSPIVTTNWPGARKFGSVGQVIPGVRVRIDRSVTSDSRHGEIVVYGPNVMRGYHNRPEENAAALRSDGGLRTGDLGYFDDDGYLFISGRIKEQYKLENGKYVMPSPLEERLKLSPFIANIMIYGDGKPCNVALVVPNAQALQVWAQKQNVILAADPIRDDRVRALLNAEIERLCDDFKEFEKPRGVALLAEDFTIANGLLTPTLKLKRAEAVARYRKVIDELYASLRAA
jgi:long-chain acyl-CoA synthetase